MKMNETYLNEKILPQFNVFYSDDGIEKINGLETNIISLIKECVDEIEKYETAVRVFNDKERYTNDKAVTEELHGSLVHLSTKIKTIIIENEPENQAVFLFCLFCKDYCNFNVVVDEYRVNYEKEMTCNLNIASFRKKVFKLIGKDADCLLETVFYTKNIPLESLLKMPIYPDNIDVNVRANIVDNLISKLYLDNKNNVISLGLKGLQYFGLIV